MVIESNCQSVLEISGLNKSYTKNKPVNADIGSAISAYEGLLESSSEKLGVKAMRNIADLELQRIELMVEANEAHLIDEATYDKAIKWYREILLNHPDQIGRAHV